MCSPPSAVDRLLQDLLGAVEVGDVDLVEAAADGVGDFLALRLRPVQDRHAGPTLGQRLCGRLAEPRRPADDDGLLTRDLHLAPFPKSARFVKQPSRRHLSVRLSGRRIGTLACMASSGARAMAGIAAAAVALGVTQLLAAFVGPECRLPHRGRVVGHRPHARAGQGMGDHHVRHGRQARAVGARARGDRVIAAVAGSMERRRAPIGSAAIVARRGRRMRGGAVPRRASPVATSSRPSSAPCAGSSCCAC